MHVEQLGRVYANDADFDAFRGRLVHQREIIGMTDDGWKIRHCIQVIDFGKPPRQVVDPDALLELEPGVEETRPATRRQRKTEQLLARIYDLLADKAMNARELAHATEQTVDRVNGVLRDLPAEVVVLRRGTWGNVYGLAGKDYTTPPLSPLMQRIVDHLRTHGPTATPDLCAALDALKASVQQTLVAYPDVVRQVGKRRNAGRNGGRPAAVWDVV